MNYNPTPKEEFVRDDAFVKSHRVLVTNDALRNSLQFALRQFTRRLAVLNPADLGSAAMLFMRQKGAEEFVEEFLNLSETPSLPKVVDLDNLKGNQPTKRQ